MNQNQRNEKQWARHTELILESSDANQLSGDDSQVCKLGKLIRQSANIDLPDASPELRQQLLEQPGLLDEQHVVLPQKTKSTSNSPEGKWLKTWAVVAILILSVGVLSLFRMEPEPVSVSDVSGLKYQTGVELTTEKNADSPPALESPTIAVPDSRQPAENADKWSTTSEGKRFDDGTVSGFDAASGDRLRMFSDYDLRGRAASNPESKKITLGDAKRLSQVPTGKDRVLLDSRNYSRTESRGFGLYEHFESEAQHSVPSSPSVRFTQLPRRELSGEDLYQIGPVFGRQNHGNTEQYAPIQENRFIGTAGSRAVSTFSIDVDTAAYANMRRFINSGQMPPRDSIRIEELVNYFSYDYPQPAGDQPFSVNLELAGCPWNAKHKLLRVGLKGKDVHVDERPASNIVFLLDVSGSMNSPDKLPLLKRGFQMLVEKLTENDRVAIVTYAGNAGVALPPTSGDQKKKINDAIERLTPGGSTHGSAGIELAYKLAQKHLIRDGVNKVILATDGDLNVGITADDALVKLIKEKAAEDVFLTVLGFGTGNLKDAKMEQLADNGNGMFAYIDSIREAHKVLVQQLSGSLVTIAKDVKIQIEFNPAEVRAYRLIGYENRMLATKDFDDDKKDAGEIGAGHTVTAIYELVTTDKPNAFLDVPPYGMKYQAEKAPAVKEKADNKVNLSAAAKSGELLTLALRYKQPDSNTSRRIEYTIRNDEKSFSSASVDFQFAASVASFGMLLRGSQFAGDSNPAMIQEIATAALDEDAFGYRSEFVDLVRKVAALCNH